MANIPVGRAAGALYGKLRVTSKTTACVDYSAGRGRSLVAYRWDGEAELKDENLACAFLFETSVTGKSRLLSPKPSRGHDNLIERWAQLQGSARRAVTLPLDQNFMSHFFILFVALGGALWVVRRIAFDVPTGDEPNWRELVKSVRRQLRAIPGNGLGFGALLLQNQPNVLIDHLIRFALRVDASAHQQNRPVRKLFHQAQIV